MSELRKNVENYLSESRKSVLETISINEMRNRNNDFQKQKDAKINIYKAFEDYIICLESSLEYEEDSYKRYLIEKEIKKLKKEQKEYYVPSALEMAASGVEKSNGLTAFAKKMKK